MVQFEDFLSAIYYQGKLLTSYINDFIYINIIVFISVIFINEIFTFESHNIYSDMENSDTMIYHRTENMSFITLLVMKRIKVSHEVVVFLCIS